MRFGGPAPMRARLILAAKDWGMYPGDIPTKPGWLRWVRERELVERALAPDAPPDDLDEGDE